MHVTPFIILKLICSPLSIPLSSQILIAQIHNNQHPIQPMLTQHPPPAPSTQLFTLLKHAKHSQPPMYSWQSLDETTRLKIEDLKAEKVAQVVREALQTGKLVRDIVGVAFRRDLEARLYGLIVGEQQGRWDQQACGWKNLDSTAVYEQQPYGQQCKTIVSGASGLCGDEVKPWQNQFSREREVKTSMEPQSTMRNLRSPSQQQKHNHVGEFTLGNMSAASDAQNFTEREKQASSVNEFTLPENDNSQEGCQVSKGGSKASRTYLMLKERCMGRAAECHKSREPKAKRIKDRVMGHVDKQNMHPNMLTN